MTQTKGKVGPRLVALVGTYLSGKTTLLESLLAASGATERKGSVGQGNAVGDSSPEARSHGMSVELNVAHANYMGDDYTFLDCPGSIEFLQDSLNALPAVDATVVVCDPDASKAGTLKPILKQLDDAGIPHLLFVNKIDKASGSIDELIQTLQAESERPLVLRQVPIMKGETVAGFIDLALERAYNYRPHQASEQVELNGELSGIEETARYQMLEQLADHDDHLMEELLEDQTPPQDEVVNGLAREVSEGLIVPVLIGSAENDNGIRRLLKALRHEVPGIAETRKRLDFSASGTSAYILKTYHTQHGGKLSVARVMSGTLKDGETLHTSGGREARIAGMQRLMGMTTGKVTEAKEGDTVALGRLDPIITGDTVGTEKAPPKGIAKPAVLEPVYSFAIEVKDRKDEVKMSAAIAKLVEEDPSLVLTHDPETLETRLSGQGEMHLRVALERIKSKYGLSLEVHPPKVPYREAIRKGVTQRGRHKKQSGGHGQFGDVVVDIQPLPRGSGFVFAETITGGAIPKNYFGAIESGIKDYLGKGPLGFPVVDVSVTLRDGSYHDVDSSDMAFRAAGRLAMQEGLPQCSPVLLEPVMKVEIHVPNAATSRVNQMVTQRRGQLLGFDARPGWPGWDTVAALIPQAELHGFIIELRSATQGAGTFHTEFDHLQELTGKSAENVLHAQEANAA
jgi:elongation factor G